MAKFTQDIAPKYRVPTNLVESGLNLASRGESFSASVAEGFDSMVGALGGGGQQWLAGHLDKTMFNESDYKVDKPEIERLKSQGVPLEDDRDYTVSQVNLIKNRFYRNLGRQSRIDDKFAFSNFVGSALPELTNPTNFIPFGRGVTGIRALGSAAPKVSKKAKYMAEGKRVRSAFESYKQVGTDALIGNAAVEPFYYMDARHQGKEHTLGNSLLNVGFGTAIGTGFFGSITAGLQFRETGRFFSEAQLYEDLYSFMETGQLDKAANVLFQNSKSFRKAIQKEKVFAEKVKDALDSDGVLRTDDMSDQELELLLSVVEKYTQKSLVSALQQSMTRYILKNFAKDEQNLTIEQFSRKYRDSFLKIHEAVNTNTVDAYLKLNKAEQEIARDLVKEFIFQDKDLAAGSMVEGEEAPWFDPETGEILPDPQAPQQFTSARYSENGYEVSSAGDTRFSAFRARLKDGRTIEQAYQEAKGSGKGQPAKDPNFDYYGTYKALWAQWAKENPELMQDLAEKARGKVLTDKFANTENNQARALAELLNENVYFAEPRASDGPELVGGFDPRGKGTPEGDGKDKAMRGVADAAIVEIEEGRTRPSSSKTSLDTLGNPTKDSTVIMLARNGGLRGKGLRDETKVAIKNAHDNGASFVVGDMPNVDSQFIDWLEEIGADYKVYHTGEKSRIQGLVSAGNKTEPVQVKYVSGVRAVKNAELNGEGVSVLRKEGEFHFGNPFSHLSSPTRDTIQTRNLSETVENYRKWLEGTDFKDVKQERRRWVLEQIDSGALDGKKLLYYSKTTPNHAEVLADFIKQRRRGKPRASSAPKPLNFRTKILKMRELRRLAVDMSQLRKDNKSADLKPTMQEMVDRGIITKKQADAYISRFNKQYGKLYRQHIEVANRVVNNIFGKEFTLKLEEEYEPEYNTLLGMFKEREGADTVFLARMDHMLIAQSDAFSVIVHEAVHALQRYDVESYNKIRQAIAENPLLEAEIERLVGKLRGYKPQDIEAELPSVLLEWAITKKEFWRTLNDSDPTVFQKLKRAIVQLFRDARKLFFNRQSHQDIFSDKNLKKLLEEDSPAELATKIGNILAEARAKQGAEGVLIDAIDSVTENANRVARITSEEIKDPKKSRFLEQNSFKSTSDANNKLRKVRTDSFLRLAALVYGKTSQAELDDLLDFIPYLEETKEVFVEKLQRLLGEDLKFGDDVVNLLYDITKKRAAISKLASNSQKLKKNMSGLDLELRRQLSRIQGDDFDAFQARQDVVDNYYITKMTAILHDSFIEIILKERLDDFKTDQQKLAFLRSYLDGQERKGTTGEFGLENKIIADSQAAAMPLMDVLAEYDLLELFMPDGTMGWFKAFKNKNKLASWRIFGRDAKQASAEFHKQLHQALIDRKLPEAWEKYEGLRVLFETLQATEFKLLKDLNSAGIEIGMLDDFGGISQKWDIDIIKSMSREAFVADLLPKLDVEATKRAIGLLEKDKDGNDVFDAKKFLGEWYDELISEQRVAEDIQVLDLDSLFTSRLVRILPESAVEVASKYSGYDSIGHLLIQQIQRRAAVATIARNAGLQPNKLLKKLAEGLNVKGKSTYSNKGAYIATVNKLTGILENPVDVHVSKIGDFIQKFSNLVFLSGSGLSSLTDIPLIASTLEMQGVKFGQNNKEFWETWQESMARKFEDPDQMRAYFLSMGAGFDILNNAVIRRLSDASGGKSGIDRLNSLLFKVNGLNAFTATHQEVYVDMLTRALARDISPEFKVNLMENGFTARDIEYMQSKKEKGPDGIFRVDPRNLTAPVAKKLRMYMTKYMRQAVIVPDIGTKAQMTMGFRKGTVEGEAARVVTQYQPFMAAMTKLLYRRFKNGSFGKTKDNATMYKMAHLVTYLGTALAFGYMVTVLKDVARGEKPTFLTDMTPFTFKRVVSQSGVLGILQVPVDAATGSGPTAAVAPFPATLFGLAWDTATGDVDGAVDAAQSFAGGDMYGVQSVYSLLGLVFTEALNEIQLNELDILED